MGKLASTTAHNRYYLARMEAAKTNDRLSSRDGASEETFIDRKRLQRIEVGTLEPYPEEVMIMADTYHAPELLNYFCTTSCPIGRHTVPRAELQQLDRLTIKFLAAIDNLRGSDRKLLHIAEDGKVSEMERPQLEEILRAVTKLTAIGCEIRMYLEKEGGTKT